MNPSAPHTATANTELDWQISRFEQLEPGQLYAILRLRQQVFVVGQNCCYQDLDGLDGASLHLCGRRGDELQAYLRCLPPGLDYAESSLGRVVVSLPARGLCLGKQLVQRGIEYNRASWPESAIKIGAQLYLERFYREFGFEAVGEVYDDHGIPHVKMLLR